MRILLAIAVVAVLSVTLFACGDEPPAPDVRPPAEAPGTSGLVYALAEDQNGEEYAYVKSYEGKAAKITVAPIAGGAPVKAFSAEAFSGKDFIEEIVFPASVGSIPDYAFENCTALKSVTAEGVSEVGADAFKATPFFEERSNGAVYFNTVLCGYKISDDRLSTVTTLKINDGTTSVTAGVLNRLSYLSDVNIPNDLPGVYGMFNGISSLQRIVVRTDGAGLLTAVDGVLYDGSTLVKYPEGKNNTSFTVPATVRGIAPRAMSNASFSTLAFAGVVDEIGDEAFLNSSRLANMNYGTNGGFKNVGRAAFKGTNFTNVTFPAALETLGEDNFAYSSLKTVRFAADGNLKVIGDRAFKGCSSLTGTDAQGNLELPDTLEKIGDSAFYKCNGIEKVNVGQGLLSLGGAAFYGLRDLKEVVLSPELEEIGGNAFYGCDALPKIVLPYSLVEIGNSAFKDCTALEIVYFGSETEQNYQNAKLNYIGISAFENCSALTSFTTPYSLEKIGSAAFRKSGLMSITVLRNKSVGITKLGLYNLDGTRVNSITVPINSVREYKAATGWSFSADSIIAAEMESGAATVFFDTDGKGLLVEKTANASMLVINRGDCDLGQFTETSEEKTESVNEEGKKVFTTTVTTYTTFVEDWYTSKDFSEDSKVVFGEDGTYRPDVLGNSYITLYAKWVTTETVEVSEEVSDD